MSATKERLAREGVNPRRHWFRSVNRGSRLACGLPTKGYTRSATGYIEHVTCLRCLKAIDRHPSETCKANRYCIRHDMYHNKGWKTRDVGRRKISATGDR